MQDNETVERVHLGDTKQLQNNNVQYISIQ